MRQSFSCPRPILILNLEALLFCFDKHESDLNFSMQKYELILKCKIGKIGKNDISYLSRKEL